MGRRPFLGISCVRILTTPRYTTTIQLSWLWLCFISVHHQPLSAFAACCAHIMSGNFKFSGTGFLQKELQGVAGFVAFQECHRRGESTTKTGLEAKIGSLYFKNDNDEDSIGLAEQLILGTGVFSGLFNKEPVPSSTNGTTTSATPEGASVNSSSAELLVLKPELHCLGTEKRIIVGGASGITLPLLMAASLKLNSANLQNRTLLCRAQEHLRNCKKALSLVNRYDSPYKSYSSTGNFPSGMVMEDYYMFVRRNMYTLLSRNDDGEHPSSLLNNDDDSPMPDTWSFPGFITFALMGPIVPSALFCYRAELLMTSPSSASSVSLSMESENTSDVVSHRTPKQSKGGRTAARKAATKEETLHRSQDTTGNRGFTTNQRLRVAGIAQSRALVTILGNRERGRIKGQIVRMHEKRVSRLEALIEGKKFIIMNTHENDPKRIEYLNELHKLHETLQTATQELASAEETAIEDAMRMDSDLNTVVMTRHDSFVDSTIRDIIALDESEDDGKARAPVDQGINKRQKTQHDDSGASELVASITEQSEEPSGLVSDGIVLAPQTLEERGELRQGQGEASSSSSSTSMT